MVLPVRHKVEFSELAEVVRKEAVVRDKFLVTRLYQAKAQEQPEMVHLELHKDRLANPVETTLRATLFLDMVENTSQLGEFDDENLEIIE